MSGLKCSLVLLEVIFFYFIVDSGVLVSKSQKGVVVSLPYLFSRITSKNAYVNPPFCLYLCVNIVFVLM